MRKHISNAVIDFYLNKRELINIVTCGKNVVKKIPAMWEQPADAVAFFLTMKNLRT